MCKEHLCAVEICQAQWPLGSLPHRDPGLQPYLSGALHQSLLSVSWYPPPSSSYRTDPRFPPPLEHSSPWAGPCTGSVAQKALGCLTSMSQAPQLLPPLPPSTFNSDHHGRQAGKWVAASPTPAPELALMVGLGLESSYDCKLICCAPSWLPRRERASRQYCITRWEPEPLPWEREKELLLCYQGSLQGPGEGGGISRLSPSL